MFRLRNIPKPAFHEENNHFESQGVYGSKMSCPLTYLGFNLINHFR